MEVCTGIAAGELCSKRAPRQEELRLGRQDYCTLKLAVEGVRVVIWGWLFCRFFVKGNHGCLRGLLALLGRRMSYP